MIGPTLACHNRDRGSLSRAACAGHGWLPIFGGFISLAFAAMAGVGSANLLLAPSDAARRVSLPPGFEATLLAGEPVVRQPIAMAFDDRGRLWVAECYTYADAKTNFDLNLHDRALRASEVPRQPASR